MLAAKLRLLRRAADLSQADLARHSSLSERTVRNLEAGHGNVTSLSAALAPLGYRLDPMPPSPLQHLSTLRGVRIVRTGAKENATSLPAPATTTPIRLKVAPATIAEASLKDPKCGG